MPVLRRNASCPANEGETRSAQASTGIDLTDVAGYRGNLIGLEHTHVFRPDADVRRPGINEASA